MVEENVENMEDRDGRAPASYSRNHSNLSLHSVHKALSEMDMLDESSDADSNFEFDI